MFDLDAVIPCIIWNWYSIGKGLSDFPYYITITDILSSHFVKRNEFKETKVGIVMSLKTV